MTETEMLIEWLAREAKNRLPKQTETNKYLNTVIVTD